VDVHGFAFAKAASFRAMMNRGWKTASILQLIGIQLLCISDINHL